MCIYTASLFTIIIYFDDMCSTKANFQTTEWHANVEQFLEISSKCLCRVHFLFSDEWILKHFKTFHTSLAFDVNSYLHLKLTKMLISGEFFRKQFVSPEIVLMFSNAFLNEVLHANKKLILVICLVVALMFFKISTWILWMDQQAYWTFKLVRHLLDC